MLTREILVQNPFQKLVKVKKLDRRDSSRVADRTPKGRTNRDEVMISVIIPAHNEEKYLAKTLAALNRQSYSNFEVIVVANGCTDRTADVARGHCHRLIVLSQKSLGVARNLGARMAKGDLLLFLDADTLFDAVALQTIADEFGTKYAAGTLKGEPDCLRLKYKMIYGLKNFMHHSGLHEGSSGVILCWRKHFIITGGFDEGLQMRENSELIRRLRKFGKYKYMPNVSAITSMRRYDHRGCGKMIWMWLKVWTQSLFVDLHDRQYETIR
jgi:glycosyltransferase involved in cell wall biosynthesis